MENLGSVVVKQWLGVVGVDIDYQVNAGARQSKRPRWSS